MLNSYLVAEPTNVEPDIQQTFTVFERWKDDFVNWVMNSQTWEVMLVALIKIAFITIATRLAIFVVHRMIDHAMKSKDHTRINVNPRRLFTVGKLLKNMISLVMNFIMIMFILSVFNVNLAPLLAGAGVIGLAVGFGAQSLVKDVMTGFFIIFEDQFAVGDVVAINQFQGTVEMIGLRSTRIHSWTGEVHIIPNGNITDVTNFSLNNSIAVVDVSIAYEENIDKATEIMKETLEKLPEQNTNMVKVPQVLGVQSLAASGITIRIIAECKPFTQAVVSRLINLEVKKSLDEHGIEIPYPKMVTYHRQEQGGPTHGA
ncbi:mechanosensitive ion channel family protein [Paenibacillus assamensis]|uniref:mechanosensitive ion channel family protein n=1 Tax=Paenibacillus assamensis TaxID=311244 RepID=UPI00041921CA|nr:mechanosensitive ion channel family protein [Paenibacillus assamensis]